MTVSRALRNQPNISPATRASVLAAARRLGYRPHPLISALMAYRRSAQRLRQEVSLAYLTNFPKREAWRKSRAFVEFFEGAQAAADRLGYRLEEYWLKEPGMTGERMSGILFSRGVAGLIIAPLPVAQGHLRLDWPKFSAVGIGYSLVWPPLHRAVNHQFRSLRMALRHLRKMGLRRVGLALKASYDERVDHHWSGAFLTEQSRLDPRERVPMLVVRDRDWQEEVFKAWFQEHRPEVVVSQHEAVLDWMQAMGVKVPHETGFVHLNCPLGPPNYAGIVQHNTAVGAAAVDFLAGMIQRNERGIPDLPQSVLVLGTWQDGPTLRAGRPIRAALAAQA